MDTRLLTISFVILLSISSVVVVQAQTPRTTKTPVSNANYIEVLRAFDTRTPSVGGRSYSTMIYGSRTMTIAKRNGFKAAGVFGSDQFVEDGFLVLPGSREGVPGIYLYCVSRSYDDDDSVHEAATAFVPMPFGNNTTEKAEGRDAQEKTYHIRIDLELIPFTSRDGSSSRIASEIRDFLDLHITVLHDEASLPRITRISSPITNYNVVAGSLSDSTPIEISADKIILIDGRDSASSDVAESFIIENIEHLEDTWELEIGEARDAIPQFGFDVLRPEVLRFERHLLAILRTVENNIPHLSGKATPVKNRISKAKFLE